MVVFRFRYSSHRLCDELIAVQLIQLPNVLQFKAALKLFYFVRFVYIFLKY